MINLIRNQRNVGIFSDIFYNFIVDLQIYLKKLKFQESVEVVSRIFSRYCLILFSSLLRKICYASVFAVGGKVIT